MEEKADFKDTPTDYIADESLSFHFICTNIEHQVLCAHTRISKITHYISSDLLLSHILQVISCTAMTNNVLYCGYSTTAMR